MGAVAPPLAALVTERLFLKPPRHPPPRREREALARGDEFAIPFRHGRLRGWRFGEGPATLLVHGWGGRAGQMAAFAPALLAAGCSVVTFDAPAHGASSGRLASVPLFAEAIAAVAEKVRPQAAIAHSMGAAGTALALLDGVALRAAVFVGPPRNPASFFERFCDVLDLRPTLQDALRRRLERRLGLPLSEFDIPRLASNQTTPLLVIHDRGDAEVAWEEGAAIAEAWPGARLVTTEGLGHRRVLRDGGAVAGAVEFIANRLPRCACGRLASHGDGAEWRCGGCLIEAELYNRSVFGTSRLVSDQTLA